jgi:tetratricopeptide (TPR) repeat protein
MFTAAEAFQIASQYYRAGQLLPAQQMFRYVLGLEPHNAEAMHLLGGISLQLREYDQALEHFRAAARASDNPVFWNDLGVACIAAGEFREGVTAIEQALQLRPEYPEAYNNLGIASQQVGEAARALDSFEQAIRLRPGYAEAYCNLGNALREQGEYEGAAVACEQAFRLRPESAEAANNLGLALQESGQVEKAADYYRLALELRPTFAGASNNLATALKELGLLEEAATQFRATLRLQPNHALVYYNLCQLVADGRATLEPAEFNHLKTLVEAGQGSPVDRSVLAFALAAVLERQGAYDQAFRYYQQANEVRRRSLEEAKREFDPFRFQAQVDQVIATFDAEYFRKVQGWGTDTDLPIFILGVPRSGTTLVEQILSSHPEVFGAGELGEMPRLLRALARTAGDVRYDPPPVLPSEDVARDLAAGYLRRLQQVGGSARRVTLKTLENFLYLGVVGTLFPRAPVLYCRREPLDVCVSCYFQNFQGSDFSWSLRDVGVYYRQYERLMAHWSRVLPMPLLEVAYEELIAHPEAVMRKMVEFCGLEWNARCLAFFNNPRPVRTSSTVQVRKPLSTRSIGRWKHFASHLEPLFEALDLTPEGTPRSPQPAAEDSTEFGRSNGTR